MADQLRVYRVNQRETKIESYARGRKKNNKPRIYRAYTFEWEEGEVDKSIFERAYDAGVALVEEVQEAAQEITEEVAVALGLSLGTSYQPLIDKAYDKVQEERGKFYLNVSVETSEGWRWYRTPVLESYEYQTRESFEDFAMGQVEAGKDYKEPRKLAPSEVGGPAIQVVFVS